MPALSQHTRSVLSTLVLCTLIACNSIPLFRLTFEPGIDGPLPWVFNYFADGHFDKARHLLFPHGPLAFLMYPLAIGNNLIAAVLITFLCSFILAFNLFFIFQKIRDKIIMAVVILFFESFLEIQLLLFAITLSFLLMNYLRRNNYVLIAAVFFAVFNLYIKSYGGVICLLLVFSQCMYALAKKDYKQAGLLAGSTLLMYVLWWMILFLKVEGMFDFLRGQVELSAGNSDAVSYFQVNFWGFISLSFFALILIPIVVADEKTRYLCLLLFLPLLAAWKHAISRGDGQHVNGYLNFLVLILFFIVVFAEKQRLRGFALSFFALCAFLTNMGATALYNDFEEQKTVSAIKTFNLYKFIVHHDSITRDKKRVNDEKNRSSVLPDHLRRLIGKSTVDIFPWNYSIIAMNRLNWIPRPTLHTYAMYSPWLDKKNAEHLASERSATFILWDIKELGGRYMSIDTRYMFNDGPEVTEVLLAGYKIIYKDEQYFLYEKQSPKKYSKAFISGKTTHQFMKWFDVPATAPSDILRARIDIRKNMAGVIKSEFFKGEGFHVSMELEDGQIVDHKIIPVTARDGVWINPFIRKPGTNTAEPRVKRLRVFCTDTAHVDPDFEVQFEKLDFGGYDYLLNFFGKEKDSVSVH